MKIASANLNQPVQGGAPSLNGFEAAAFPSDSVGTAGSFELALMGAAPSPATTTGQSSGVMKESFAGVGNTEETPVQPLISSSAQPATAALNSSNTSAKSSDGSGLGNKKTKSGDQGPKNSELTEEQQAMIANGQVIQPAALLAVGVLNSASLALQCETASKVVAGGDSSASAVEAVGMGKHTLSKFKALSVVPSSSAFSSARTADELLVTGGEGPKPTADTVVSANAQNIALTSENHPALAGLVSGDSNGENLTSDLADLVSKGLPETSQSVPQPLSSANVKTSLPQQTAKDVTTPKNQSQATPSLQSLASNRTAKAVTDLTNQPAPALEHIASESLLAANTGTADKEIANEKQSSQLFQNWLSAAKPSAETRFTDSFEAKSATVPEILPDSVAPQNRSEPEAMPPTAMLFKTALGAKDVLVSGDQNLKSPQPTIAPADSAKQSAASSKIVNPAKPAGSSSTITVVKEISSEEIATPQIAIPDEQPKATQASNGNSLKLGKSSDAQLQANIPKKAESNPVPGEAGATTKAPTRSVSESAAAQGPIASQNPLEGGDNFTGLETDLALLAKVTSAIKSVGEQKNSRPLPQPISLASSSRSNIQPPVPQNTSTSPSAKPETPESSSEPQALETATTSLENPDLASLGVPKQNGVQERSSVSEIFRRAPSAKTEFIKDSATSRMGGGRLGGGASVAGGTLDAQHSSGMAFTADNRALSDGVGKNIPTVGKNDSAAREAEQILPRAEFDVIRNRLTPELPTLVGGTARIEAQESRFGHDANSHDVSASGNSRLANEVWSAVQSFRATSSHDWEVKIRPDQSTQLNLTLKLQDNQLVVHAKLESGNWDLVAPQWRELQAVLAERGTQLRPLEMGAGSNGTPNHSSAQHFGAGNEQQRNGASNFARDREWMELESASVSKPAAEFKKPAAPATARPKSTQVLETWA